MLFGNEDENIRGNFDDLHGSSDSGSGSGSIHEENLDYLYGQVPERPIYAGRTSEASEKYSEQRAINSGLSSANQVLDREGQVETQSGFMLVFKGNRDKATFSVRRKVGTPPTSAVTLTPDELRRLTNLVSELMPEPASREMLSVGAARALENTADRGDQPFGRELDTFIEREYPEIARRRRTRQPRPTVNKKAVVIASAVLLGAALVTGAAFHFLNAKPFAHAARAQSEIATPSVEEIARNFVSDMLDFKSASYRQSQIKAMAMMSDDLSSRYWQETHFPLSKSQLRKMPAQELTIDSVNPVVLSPNNYQVDVKGTLTTNKPIAILIRLSMTKGSDGKYLVTDQKDLSGTVAEPTANTVSGSAGSAGSASPAPTQAANH
jgi:hypothetical protein